ncbi:MAG: thymidylate synthase [Sarcina sp.]
MKQYLELCKDVLENGNVRDDRTGTGTIGVFGRQLRFDLEKSFPVLTTKRVYWKGVVAELLWFLNGDTNIKYLVDNNVHIWDAWADENGELGRIYSAQWRGFRGYTDTNGEIEVFEVDQIKNLIEQIKTNPMSRRHLVVAYNPADADKCGLPACHSFFQFYVNGDELSCQFYMRSNDVFLGLPFNIASYALLTHMVARATGLKAKELIYSVGDCHIYQNHLEQVKTQLERTPKDLPTLKINTENTDIFSYKIEDFVLENYNPDAAIKAEVSV